MTLPDADITWITDLAKPERDRGYTRTFFSYPAKFLAKLPRGLIERFTSEGDFVLDPFNGGGTTGLEAMLLNRRFYGCDINPFAIFLSKIKTTWLESDVLHFFLNSIIKEIDEEENPLPDFLDADDRICLGEKIANEINSLVTGISNIKSTNQDFQNFFHLGLIHAIKIVGRRDFEAKSNWQEASLIPIFVRKIKKMIQQISFLPRDPQFEPIFKLASNHQIDLESASVDLLVTSPPYKDKDVEYQKIQIQRRSLKKSKRSDVISSILKRNPLSKRELCWTGKSGMNYWENSQKSMIECYRLLKHSKYAFIWVGFKTTSDLHQFKSQLSDVGFKPIATIHVSLSNDRAASGRSTYHGRPTGMMSHDNLFVVQKE